LIVDPMHGLGCRRCPLPQCSPAVRMDLAEAGEAIREIRSQRDPTLGAIPPEPLAAYLGELIEAVRASPRAGAPGSGHRLDGDGRPHAGHLMKQGRYLQHPAAHCPC